MDDEDWHEIPPNADGSYTITEPGLYGVTIGGVRYPRFRAVGDPAASIETLRRELPKDEPAAQYTGRPEKWRTMNRAQRRAAKRSRP